MLFSLFSLTALAGISVASCPYMAADAPCPRDHPVIEGRSTTPDTSTEQFLSQFELNDTNAFMTTDSGTPIQDQNSLKAGARGPTLLEDFIFRQKIQHFDHERVPERAVHARGAGAHGTFTSYGDWSNITAASFLNTAGKETPMFARFSTVAGSRGSADTARDVHGFATRFYTDEGNFDIVGNNIPVFFIQDAILFPDLIHAVKPQPNNEIPQAATAHDTAWDFFSGQPSALHTLFWAMAGFGIPRSFRHMDGFGIHTYRFVTDDGSSKLVKFHWNTMQGKASLVWEEAQAVAGQNPDFMRQDLYDAIAAGQGPSWELGVQIMDEGDELKYGFDLLDPTKIVPEELVPVTKLGKMTLNLNPTNYFAETEQVMFQPGHIVRGVDFSEDPLLQGRIFSYLDTQLNRNNGPNFEQLPINRPRVPIHNNNRDGASQGFIPLNEAAYTPNTAGTGPKQATQSVGRGFFTTPGRTVSGTLTRNLSDTFSDVWSQPRLFYNSLLPQEQQFLINAIRFETSKLTSTIVKQNVLIQLNRISNDIARRVAQVLNLVAPAPDPTYYNNNKSSAISIFNNTLLTIDGLNVGILTTNTNVASIAQAVALASALSAAGTNPTIIGETLSSDITETYSAASATAFDAIIITSGTESIFTSNATSPLYPAGRPVEIAQQSYNWGKPVGAMGAASTAIAIAGIKVTPGVYIANGNGTDGVSAMVTNIEEGLKKFKFLDRFAMDPDANSTSY